MAVVHHRVCDRRSLLLAYGRDLLRWVEKLSLLSLALLPLTFSGKPAESNRRPAMAGSGNMVLAFGALIAGAVVVDYGVKNFKGGLSSGSSSTGGASVPAATTSTSSSKMSPIQVPKSTSGVGGTFLGEITNADLDTVARLHGWDASEVSAWKQLIPLESNGTTTDTNPKSGAYGIAQFIDGAGEYAQYGGNSTTVLGQLTSMANYMEGRYGTPSGALSFHLANGWY